MEHTESLEYELDGTLYRGEVPTGPPKKPGRPRVVKGDDWQAFEAAVVRRIVALGASGPETFRFLRSFCALSMVDFAKLIGVDRTTVHRWEAGDVPIPRATTALVMTMAAKKAKVRTDVTNVLARLGEEGERPEVVEVEAA